jgi:hypothetical protein
MSIQVKFLEEEFEKNPHWSNEDVERISKTLRIEKAKVYKWNWDQKKKLNILPSKVYEYEIPEGKIYVKSAQELANLQKELEQKKAQQ